MGGAGDARSLSGGAWETQLRLSLCGRCYNQAFSSRSMLGRRSLSSDKKRGFRVEDGGLGAEEPG